MKLVVLYGSEGVGKLTVGRCLAAQTGLRLFHNHLSVDVAKVLYDYGDPRYEEVLWGVRLMVMKSAAVHDVPGLIFTWAYSHPDFQPLLDRVDETLAPFDAEILMVHLKTSQDELERRVVSEERRQAGKICTVAHLRQQQTRKNHVEIPGRTALVVDNTSMTPERAASVIAEALELSP